MPICQSGLAPRAHSVSLDPTTMWRSSSNQSSTPMEASAWSIWYLTRQNLRFQPYFYYLDFIKVAWRAQLLPFEDIETHTYNQTAALTKTGWNICQDQDKRHQGRRRGVSEWESEREREREKSVVVTIKSKLNWIRLNCAPYLCAYSTANKITGSSISDPELVHATLLPGTGES